jgi:hypothetical protein
MSGITKIAAKIATKPTRNERANAVRNITVLLDAYWMRVSGARHSQPRSRESILRARRDFCVQL